MKILLITQNFYPELGPAANRIKIIFKLLLKSKHDAYVLTTTPTYPTKELYKDNRYFNDEFINNYSRKNIYRLKIKHLKQSSKLYLRLLYFANEFISLRCFLKKHQYNYEYIYVTSPNIFMAWAVLFFKKKNINYILEIRDLWPDSANHIEGINIKLLMPLLKYLEKKMYVAADKIVINNLSFGQYINNITVKTPIFYLPNAIQQSEMPNSSKHKTFSVIYTGNVGHAQDVNKLIEIAKKLNNHCIQLTLIIYGVKADYFKKKVNHLKYVSIKPPLNRQECLKEIAKSHISLSILKSSEIFLNVMPGKLVDAISMGTIPVTNLGGHAETIINDNYIGIAKKNIGVDDLITKIIELKKQPELQKQMQKNAINYRNNNFIWENNIKNLENFLLEGDYYG